MDNAAKEEWWKARGRFIDLEDRREQALADIRDLFGHVSKCPHSEDPNAGVLAIALIRQIETCAGRARDALTQNRK